MAEADKYLIRFFEISKKYENTEIYDSAYANAMDTEHEAGGCNYESDLFFKTFVRTFESLLEQNY